jgi:hypothetical protein
MPDPDRLNDLRRQRALVAEQLAWLDREIAAASGAAPAPKPLAAPPVAQATTPRPVPMQILPPLAPLTPPAAIDTDISPDVAAHADTLLDEYRVAPAAMKSDVKKGCFGYFFAALALLALGVAAIYYSYGHGK